MTAFDFKVIFRQLICNKITRVDNEVTKMKNARNEVAKLNLRGFDTSV